MLGLTSTWFAASLELKTLCILFSRSALPSPWEILRHNAIFALSRCLSAKGGIRSSALSGLTFPNDTQAHALSGASVNLLRVTLSTGSDRGASIWPLDMRGIDINTYTVQEHGAATAQA